MPSTLRSESKSTFAVRTLLSKLCLLTICQITPLPSLDRAVAQDSAEQRAKAANTQTLTIEGVCVRADSGRPIEGAKLTLFEVTGPSEQIRELHSVTSDKEGRYSFTNLLPTNQSRTAHRSYIVKAAADGCPDVVFDYRHNFDMNGWATRLQVLAGTGSIKGRITDEQGNPLAGAIVQRAHVAPADKLGLKTAKTNKEGLFILGGMPVIDGKPLGSRSHIRVYHPNYPVTQFTRNSLDFSTFVMPQACTVEGIVIDAASQKPLVGITLSAVTADTKYESREGKTTTDDQGRFRLILVEGNYNLILEDQKYVAKFNYLECRKGGTIKLESIQASLGGWIVGRVINTDTNKPVVTTDIGNGQFERVGVGLFGPDRPMGDLIHTHWLDEVDDQGRFRMLAHPGENFPYLCNLRGNRNTWETSKQPPVIVEAGKETRYDLTYEPPRTPEQKMEKAKLVLDKLPTQVESRVAGIIAEFRKLNQTVDECEIWCLLMRELVQIGKPAVPAICKELEATDSSAMMRRLAFALRAIGDPRAVPSLIRSIPQTLQPPMSDYGLIVDDPELMKFMQTHDLNEKGPAGHFSLGRPMREVYSALNKLTKRNQDVTLLASVKQSSDRRAFARQEKIYYEAAREWADWWESNWQKFGVDQAFSKVNLPAFKLRDTSDYPVGMELTETAKVDNGLIGQVLTPIGDTDSGATFFMDLDTGQSTKWPNDLTANDDSLQSVEVARSFADQHGFDLMCVSEENVDGAVSFTLVGVGLELWEIDSNDAKNLERFISQGKLPEGRKLESQSLVHRDTESDSETSALGSSFLYLTKDQGLGMITLTDFVTTARDISGMASAPRGVGFHRGVKIDYYQIAR